MLYAFSIVPIFLYIGVLIQLDSFSLIRKGRLAASIFCGVASCVTVFILLRFTNLSSPSGIYFTPFIEEFIKGITILLLIRMKKIAFSIDAAIYGAAVGGGFALLENILYIAFNPMMDVATAIFRGLGTSIMHIGLTAIVGILLIMMTRKGNDPIFCYLSAIIPSSLLHILFNLFLINPFILLLIDLLLLTAVFVLLFYQDQKAIHKWIDNTMFKDAKLLADIKKGNLDTTPAGLYLLSIKEQFRPEVYFDMLCYVGLYLELSLTAKRNLILSEVGMNIPEDETIKSVITEFKSLEKQIGKTGKIALSPIVSTKKVDKWLIENRL